jgi:uncharacterized protein (DUF1684 family)
MKNLTLIAALFFITGTMQFAFSQTRDEAIRQYSQEITTSRNLKNAQFSRQEESPLSVAQLENFDGLNYFPVDYDYRIEGNFEALGTPKTEQLATTSDSKISLSKVGKVTFKLQGKTYSLDVYQNNNLPEFGDSKQLFIPFSDATNGNETTVKGRYLPVKLPARGEAMMVDFNQAINPFFAYGDQFSSIIPPQTNAMGSGIPSGERKFEDRR